MEEGFASRDGALRSDFNLLPIYICLVRQNLTEYGNRVVLLKNKKLSSRVLDKPYPARMNSFGMNCALTRQQFPTF